MPLRKLKDKLTDQLFSAVLSLQTESECYKFFEDICTVGELKSLGQRLEVARLLKEGGTYEAIVEQTSVSTATIARVKRCLDYGADGYGIALSRLAEQKIAGKEKRKNVKG